MLLCIDVVVNVVARSVVSILWFWLVWFVWGVLVFNGDVVDDFVGGLLVVCFDLFASAMFRWVAVVYFVADCVV